MHIILDINVCNMNIVQKAERDKRTCGTTETDFLR